MVADQLRRTGSNISALRLATLRTEFSRTPQWSGHPRTHQNRLPSRGHGCAHAGSWRPCVEPAASTPHAPVDRACGQGLARKRMQSRSGGQTSRSSRTSKASLRLIEKFGLPEGLGKVSIDPVIRQPDDRILEGRLERKFTVFHQSSPSEYPDSRWWRMRATRTRSRASSNS